MGRERSQESIEAERLYHEGMLLVDIAKKLGKPPGTVRRWKADQNWDGNKKQQPERSEKKRTKPNATKPSAPKSKPTLSSSDKAVLAAIAENEELTEKQKLFCTLFVQCLSPTRAYKKAYDCPYDSAKANGWKLLQNIAVRAEVERLKKIKAEALMLEGVDIVEFHMRILASDITDYVEFGRSKRLVTSHGQPVYVEHPSTGEKIPMTETINVVSFRESTEVDGMLLSEVSEGRDGAKIKLIDKQRSLQFLERYFELNPMDNHKKRFDELRHQLEVDKFAEAKDKEISEIEDTADVDEVIYG